MTSDEIPPRWMWHLDKELEIHFEEVDAKRKERYGTPGEDTEVPLMGNDLASAKRR